MKGFVPTPRDTVDRMIELLFRNGPPSPHAAVLDPGCGTGEFIDGIIRWCEERQLELPKIIGVESDPRHLPVLSQKYLGINSIKIEHGDFLVPLEQRYEFIVGNPPYVSITELSQSEKERYRAQFLTARGRFDLYSLFFESAISSLAPGGRLVFITPEKYLYVQSAAPLRRLLARLHIEEIQLLPEDIFGDLITYPTITVINHRPPDTTRIRHRNGSITAIEPLSGQHSWLPQINQSSFSNGIITLKDLCLRISCGVATGADGVFVRPLEDLTSGLRAFAYPTVAGRELQLGSREFVGGRVLLSPYDSAGRLLPFEQLGALADYLNQEEVRTKLLARTCARRKPWYAFHETPPFQDMLRPKIICKDISEKPGFWPERSGEIVPRHSVYYIVPRVSGALDVILEFLQSRSAHQWLIQNCQRAAQGYLRLQSHVLQQLPIPRDVSIAAGYEFRYSETGAPAVQSEMPLNEAHIGA